MEEPILDQEQKQEWIDVFESIKLDDVDYDFFLLRKQFLKDGYDLQCKNRVDMCNVLIKQQGIVEKDCLLCWVNWFIHYHQLLLPITDEQIEELFGNKKAAEVLKRDSFACYTLAFASCKNGNLDNVIENANQAIIYLST